VSVDPRLTAALQRQLEQRRRLLDAGATRVGWKLGMGASERIGNHPAVGYLTSDSRLEPGAEYPVGAPVKLRADAEVAVELGPDLAVRGFAPALELVDLGPPADADEIVATNIFHRAFALGDFQQRLPREARLIVNSEQQDRSAVPTDLTDRLELAAHVLATVGEQFAPGDVVITGSIVQAPVPADAEVVAHFGELGSVSLRTV
jgi:2-keto-4-pentenoate hydratase